jgi:hypothetical protein
MFYQLSTLKHLEESVSASLSEESKEIKEDSVTEFRKKSVRNRPFNVELSVWYRETKQFKAPY